MPLTEEQQARMEANRLMALARRGSPAAAVDVGGRGPVGCVTVTKTVTPMVVPATVAKPPAVSGSNVAKPSAFYGGTTKLKGQAVLTSKTRFTMKIGFHDRAVSVFKTIDSGQYQAGNRVWTFAVTDHDLLMSRLAPLRPDVVVEPLPKWIVKTFTIMRKATEDSVSLQSRLETTLFDALMPFQLEGIEFSLRRNGRVLIADDMGLGKTIQALGVASAFRAKWPLLICCPSSVRFSWRDAVVRWIPSIPQDDISVITTGKDPLHNAKVVILSYDLLSKKEKELCDKAFQVAIMDESHFLKNNKSIRLKSAEKVLKRTEHLILLSGTPALSRPIELYSQLSLLLPKLFPYATEYGMRYCSGKKVCFGGRGAHFDFSGSSNMDELKLLMEETCMIRRLKSDVLTQLPAKQRQMIILDPAAVKTRTKEMATQAAKMGQKSLTSGEKRGILLEWFNLTGQSKTKAVLEYLKDLLEGEKKFLCFAHHQSMLDTIEELLEKQKVRFVRIDGRTSSEARNRNCEKFQTDDRTRVALLSITAANAGITLTAAQLVVFAELFWNPGILTQAEDRAHRIGQTDSVIIQYLVAKGTADDELWPLLQRKLDVLNKAGLSKDNFQESDATYAKTADDDAEVKQSSSTNGSKITDYFSSSLLEDLDLEAWDADDSFGMEEDGGSKTKRPREEA